MKPLLISLMWCLLACGTEQRRLTFPVEAAGNARNLVTDSGWSVTLSRATVHLSTVRFFEGRVLLTRAAPWWRSLLVSEAWAHPDHSIPGAAMAEVLTPLQLDLLAPEPTAWGDADGITGSYGSVQLGFESLGLELEGAAHKCGQSVEFSGHFAPSAELEGVRFEREMSSSPGTVTLTIGLGAVLSRIDFAQVGTGAKPLDAQSPAYNGLARGVVDTSAYLVTRKEN